MLCAFCLALYPDDESKDREARTVKNGQAVCFRHLCYVPDSTESFNDIVKLIKRNEARYLG